MVGQFKRNDRYLGIKKPRLSGAESALSVLSTCPKHSRYTVSVNCELRFCSMDEATNSSMFCPACGGKLKKHPQRKTKCKHCGEYIFVKTTPDNREKRLMTQHEAEEAERQWYAHQMEEQLNRLSSPERLKTAFGRASRAAFLGQPFKAELAEAKLEDIQRLPADVNHVKIIADDNACPACARVHEIIITVEEARVHKPLPLDDCTCELYGQKGFCRCWYMIIFDDELGVSSPSTAAKPTKSLWHYDATPVLLAIIFFTFMWLVFM